MRSIQYNSTNQTSKRQNFENGEHNDGGLVVDYYFLDENESAYDSFHSTSTLIKNFANDAISDMASSNTVIECADFGDSGGILDGGLLTVGWNNQAYQIDEPGESESLTRECYQDET